MSPESKNLILFEFNRELLRFKTSRQARRINDFYFFMRFEHEFSDSGNVRLTSSSISINI